MMFDTGTTARWARTRHPMSKRRQPAPRPSRPFRGRRINQPRTPEDNVRVSAAWVLERTLSSLAPSAEFLSSALDRCDECDRGLLRELALGSLRWLRRLDHVIGTASHRPFEKIEPELKAPLRVATYQLLFLDRVPAHAELAGNYPSAPTEAMQTDHLLNSMHVDPPGAHSPSSWARVEP